MLIWSHTQVSWNRNGIFTRGLTHACAIFTRLSFGLRPRLISRAWGRGYIRTCVTNSNWPIYENMPRHMIYKKNKLKAEPIATQAVTAGQVVEHPIHVSVRASKQHTCIYMNMYVQVYINNIKPL